MPWILSMTNTGVCQTCVKDSVPVHGIVSFFLKWDYNKPEFCVSLSILSVLGFIALKRMLMFSFWNVNKLKLLPILLGDCGKLKNSGDYSCSLIHTVLVYTLSSNMNYCESATAKLVENFAITFRIATAVVSYKWSEHSVHFFSL